MTTKLIGMMLTRNESWIFGFTARVALRWVDELVILDHRSADRTPEMIDALSAEYPGRVTVVRDPQEHWNEMDMRQAMLVAARGRGMTHGAIIDADEALTADLVVDARAMAIGSPPGQCVHLPMHCPLGTLRHVRKHPAFVDKWIGVWFKDEPHLYYAAREGGYQLHSRAPRNLNQLNVNMDAGLGRGCWHIQFITERRLQIKAAWYKAMERIRWEHRMTPAQLNTMYDWAIGKEHPHEAAPDSWRAGYADLIEIHFRRPDAVPWQLEALREMIREHGREKFAGLDLHGYDDFNKTG